MAKHKITLIFEDGRSEVIESDESDTIYMAALRNKVRLMTDCLEGACATCKAKVVSGQFSLDDYADEALTDEESKAGEALTCQMHAHTDCVIEFPYHSKIAFKSGPQTWDCYIKALTQVSSNVVRLDLCLKDESVLGPQFVAGQYVNLSVPGTDQSRSYSFANGPQNNSEYTFYIKLLGRGVMSDFLRDQAGEGDPISIAGPYGHFYLRNPGQPLLMISGGTGLAPMFSMLEHLVRNQLTSASVRLLYGVNHPDEFFNLSQIEEYQSYFTDFQYQIISLSGAENWSGSLGYVTDLMKPEIISAAHQIYLCGPPPMIDAALARLSEHSMGPNCIYFEKFVAS